MISNNNILSDYYGILGDNCVHTIRMYIEVFGAALCHITPIYMLTTLIQQLQDFNHTQQKLSSLFIILGHICIDSSSSNNNYSSDNSNNISNSNNVGSGGVGTNNSETSTINNTNITTTTNNNIHTSGGGTGIDSKVLTLTLKRQICHLLIAWSSCASGLPRAIAQLVIYTLGAQIKAVTTANTTTTCIDTYTSTEAAVIDNDINNSISNIHAIPAPSDPLDTSIYQVCTFLEQNRDSIKLLQRQQGFFSEYFSVYAMYIFRFVRCTEA